MVGESLDYQNRGNMITIYELNLQVEGKPVQFQMNVDESLKPMQKIDDKTVCKWRTRLQAIANTFTGETE